MRLAVLSDIHGNLLALEAALADLDAAGGADHTWILGDLAAFGPRPAECIQLVQDLQNDKEAQVLSGNTDRYLVTGARPHSAPVEAEDPFKTLHEQWHKRDTELNWALSKLSFNEYDYLRKLPGDLAVEAEGYGWIVGYHGTPGDDEGMLTPETDDEAAADALLDREGWLGVGGHIHKQMDRQVNSWRLINVGSVGMSFDMPGLVQWGLFTFENGAVTVDLRHVPYAVDSAIADMQAVKYPIADRVQKWRPA